MSESLANKPAMRCFYRTRLRHSCFLMSFVKLLKTFLQNNFWRLLLYLWNIFVIYKDLISISQCGFSRKKTLEAVVRRCYPKQAWRPTTILKIDSSTGLFLLNLRNFQEHLFAQNTSGGYFCYVNMISSSLPIL